jgi:hypothetical protein
LPNKSSQIIKSGAAILVVAALFAFYSMRSPKKEAVRNANQAGGHIALLTEKAEGLAEGIATALGKPVSEVVLTGGMQSAASELAAKVEAGVLPRPKVLIIAAGHSATDLGGLIKNVEQASQTFISEGRLVAFLPRVPAEVGDNFNLMAADLCRHVGALCLGLSDSGRSRRELSAPEIAAALKPYL